MNLKTRDINDGFFCIKFKHVRIRELNVIDDDWGESAIPVSFEWAQHDYIQDFWLVDP